MIFSHSFDVTAGSIDNTVGTLDGYSAIVFEGSNTPRVKEKSHVDRILDKASDLLNLKEQENIDDTNTVQATKDNVNTIFKDKGTAICNFKVDDYSAYSRGQIFERGKWKFGVLSADNSSDIQEKIDNLRNNNNADIVILISPSDDILKHVEKVDCLIAKNVTSDIPDEGKSINNTFVMRVPDSGKVGAILSSPAKMMQGSVYTKVKN